MKNDRKKHGSNYQASAMSFIPYGILCVGSSVSVFCLLNNMIIKWSKWLTLLSVKIIETTTPRLESHKAMKIVEA